MPKLSEVASEELRGREYLKPYLEKDAMEVLPELLKKLDGAETLIGKRPAVPTRDAADADLDKHFSQFRPDKPDDYEIPLPQGAKPDLQFLKAVREAFHDGNISKRQAARFLAKMGEFGQARDKDAQAVNAKKAQEFDTLVKSALGAENKVVLERAMKAIRENAPAALKAHLDKMDDPNMVLMTGVVNAIMEKYIPKGDLDGKAPAGGEGGGAKTVGSLNERVRALMADKSFADWQNPKHAETNAEVKRLCQEIAALQGT